MPCFLRRLPPWGPLSPSDESSCGRASGSCRGFQGLIGQICGESEGGKVGQGDGGGGFQRPPNQLSPTFPGALPSSPPRPHLPPSPSSLSPPRRPSISPSSPPPPPPSLPLCRPSISPISKPHLHPPSPPHLLPPPPPYLPTPPGPVQSPPSSPPGATRGLFSPLPPEGAGEHGFGQVRALPAALQDSG